MPNAEVQLLEAGYFVLPTTAADIERILKAHKIAAFVTIQGKARDRRRSGSAADLLLAGDTSMTLTHARNTNRADSASDTPAHNGLKDFGKEVVLEMNPLGILADLAHISDHAFYDPLAARTKRGLFPILRCRQFPMLRGMCRRNATCTRQGRRGRRSKKLLGKRGYGGGNDGGCGGSP